MAFGRARGRVLPSVLRGDELPRLLSAASSPRDRCILVSAAFVGLRVSEVAHLRVEHVYLDSAQLFVDQGKGSKDAWLPIPRRVLSVFAECVGDRRDGPMFLTHRPGFSGAITPRGIRYLVARLSAAAGIRHVWPHALRHTYATSLLDAGVGLLEVRDLMRHESVATTEIYLHLLPERLRSAAENLGGDFGVSQSRLWAVR